jgi:hypothetical protein
MRAVRVFDRLRSTPQTARSAEFARARYGRRFLLLPLACLLLVAGAWIAFPFLFERYGHLSPVGWRAPLDVVATVWVFGLVLAPAGAFAAVRRGMVARCERLQRDGPRCAACAFPLTGLPSRDGAIICPECGRHHTFV